MVPSEIYHLRLFLLRCAFASRLVVMLTLWRLCWRVVLNRPGPNGNTFPQSFIVVLFSPENTDPVLCKDCEEDLSTGGKQIIQPAQTGRRKNECHFKGVSQDACYASNAIIPFNRFRKAGKTPEIFMPPTQKGHISWVCGRLRLRPREIIQHQRINTWGNTNIRDAAKIAQRMN